MSDVVLHGGSIWTLAQPPAASIVEALLIRDGQVVAAGTAREARAAARSTYDDLALRGDTVLPAFIDAHLHLLSWAAALRGVDCSPRAVRSIPELLAAIRARAASLPPGRWLRAWGYRESELAERRHPTRWDLDAAAPRNPVRLDHGSGHAVVLNSAALQAVGLTTETEAPEGGEIGRRLDDGEPDGLLLEMGGWLEGRMPPMEADDLRAGVAEAGRRLIAAGIGTVHDLGARNNLATVALLDGFVREGTLPAAVSVALGYEAFARGERTRSSRLVKLMVNDIGDEPLPALDALAAMIAAIDAAGLIAAVHCVTAPAIERAVAAFERALAGRARGVLHRLEHAAVCPPQLARRTATLPLRCVLNPALICLDGDRYLREVRPESLPWLHNPATLIAAGAPIAAGSDAPVAAPSPLTGIAAMTARSTVSGETVPGATTSLEYAVAAHTAFAADAAGDATLRGRLVPGSPADLVVLPRGWDQAGHCSTATVARTMLGGRWRND